MSYAQQLNIAKTMSKNKYKTDHRHVKPV